MLKTLAATLPTEYQRELKRILYARQIRRGRFRTDEPEFARLQEWIHPGDLVIDVGANIGHYTLRLAELVGPEGRVVAIEPVPETFAILAENVVRSNSKNVTLVNAAAADSNGIVGMCIPSSNSGIPNYFEAMVVETGAEFSVMSVLVDCFGISIRAALVKVDAEGQELAALKGMRQLVTRDRPILIVEDNSADVDAFLADLGYTSQKFENSPNKVFKVG